MDYPFLRGMMRLCRMRQYELAQFLKMSDASFSLRLAGRREFSKLERIRLPAHADRGPTGPEADSDVAGDAGGGSAGGEGRQA